MRQDIFSSYLTQTITIFTGSLAVGMGITDFKHGHIFYGVGLLVVALISAWAFNEIARIRAQMRRQR